MHNRFRPFWGFRTFLRLAIAHPRQTVFVCFAVVFAITLVLAGRQYWLGRERQVNDRQHHLHLQALVIDAAFHGAKQRLRFLRDSAEHILADVQNDSVSATIDEALKNALQARQMPTWGLQGPLANAPIRALGDQPLASIPGFSRDARTLKQDLMLSRVLSQLLPAQYQTSPDLARAAFISTTGVVVAYPPIADDKLEPVLNEFSATWLAQARAGQVADFDVAFLTIEARHLATGPYLMLISPVMSTGAVRGAIVFGFPQERLQSYLIASSLPEERHALLDARGTLIASNEETFIKQDGNWLTTLPAQLPGLTLPGLFQTKVGALHDADDYVLYRELPEAGLMLVDHIPADTIRWRVISQFSTAFVCIWISLGLLLVMTLFIVDLLLTRQMALNAQLRELGLVDTLTQLANRRRLQMDFKGMVRRFGGEHPIALLMLDIDKFKNINDNWGHSAGDEVLKHLATLCRALVRPQDLVARYGGEEFCFVLPDTTSVKAVEIAEKLRLGIEQSVCLPDAATMLTSAPSREIWLTVSIGVAEFNADGAANLEELIAKADRRLYAAKQNGRNRVVADDALTM
ncbi:diguanylate cyclase [Pseudomonas akapageensis]|uniref:diguanylate cyclase n=1 Tax=Pseudomonas akapageensis TaxID=2609961 RepID=UPI00140BCBAB|nr:diguanylate cyclase [Pseudomonas akapageensis]